jgi:hypothetical protein
MQHTKVIGFRGPKGVGKNFCADIASKTLQTLNCLGYSTDSANVDQVALENIESGALADPIKEFLYKNLFIEKEWCYGTDAQKNTLTIYDWADMFKEIQDANNKYQGKMTAREVMQVFGTDICRRCFGPDIWLHAMKRRIDRSNADWFWITDIRFVNEVNVVRNVWGGQVWNIDGPQRGEESSKKDAHPSEKETEIQVQVDHVIFNGLSQPVEDLEKQIKTAILTARK